MWDHLKQLVDAARTFVFVVFVLWALVMLTLGMTGHIVEADCPVCWTIIDKGLGRVLGVADAAAAVHTEVTAVEPPLASMRVARPDGQIMFAATLR